MESTKENVVDNVVVEQPVVEKKPIKVKKAVEKPVKETEVKEKKVRKARFEKGSQEAKDYMSSIRVKKGLNKATSVKDIVNSAEKTLKI